MQRAEHLPFGYRTYAFTASASGAGSGCRRAGVMRGEVVGVAVVLHKDTHTGESALQKFCLERMANYKAPKYFAFMDSLPVAADGKVDKKAIREHFIRRPSPQSDSD